MNSVNQALLEQLRLQRKSLVDADGNVRVDAPCRGCGYNLRGIGADGGCPECGHAVADALRDDRPEHSDPRWLRHVALGANLLVLAGVIAVVNVVLVLLISLIAELTLSPAVGRAMGGYFFYGMLAIGGLNWLLACSACWLATARDPGQLDPRADAVTRWLARVGLIGWLPTFALAAGVAPQLNSFAGWIDRALLFCLYTTPVLFIAVGLIALLLCFRTLCLRMSEWGVSRSITTVCYGVGATALVYIVSLGVLAAAGRHATLAPFLCCGCDFFVAAFFVLWAVVLIDFTRRALNMSKARAADPRHDD